MDSATMDLLELWDVVRRTVDDLDDADWDRPLPGPGPGPADVAELVAQLSGLHYAARDAAHDGLSAARHRTAVQLAGCAADDPALGARCLEMCLHVHDLTEAIGHPEDLRHHDPAARAACALVLRVLPRLLVAAVGAGDASLSLAVRPGEGHAVHVDHGAVVPEAPAVPDAIETEPAALLLLLAGRRDADALHDEGALDWSGPVADAFVRRASLLAAQRSPAAANAG